MESLADKLRSLGVITGAKSAPVKQPVVSRRETIESAIGGTEGNNQFGYYYYIEKTYPLSQPHGFISMDTTVSLSMLYRWAKVAPEQQVDLSRLVFIDTETTGLAGGTGTLAFMVGIGFFEQEQFHLHQYFLRNVEEEPAMLAAIDSVVAPFDGLVSFNGRAFDVPLLNNRYLLNGLDSPCKNRYQIDLLHLARRMWKNRLASRALGTIEKEILGFLRSEEEVPGWMAPELYFNYLKNNNVEGIVPVFYHNAMDIVSLGALLIHFAAIISNPLQHQSLPGLDLVAIGHLYAGLEELDTAIRLYEKGIEEGVPEEFYTNALMRQATLCKKQGDYDYAIANWEKAAEMGNLTACEELAKVYEHQFANYELAMQWVGRANDILETMPKHNFVRRQQTQLFQHRLERLLGKWKSKTEG